VAVKPTVADARSAVPVDGAAREVGGGILLVEIDMLRRKADAPGDLVAQPGYPRMPVIPRAGGRAVDVPMTREVRQAPIQFRQPAGVEDIDAFLVGLPGKEVRRGITHGLRRRDGRKITDHAQGHAAGIRSAGMGADDVVAAPVTLEYYAVFIHEVVIANVAPAV